MNDKVFAQGFVIKERHENTPEWVMANVSIRVSEFKTFMDNHQDKDWVNIQLKVSKGGKAYAELDTWKPNQGDVHDQGLAKAKASLDNSVPAGFDDMEDNIPF
jgi:hypothetical protein